MGLHVHRRMTDCHGDTMFCEFDPLDAEGVAQAELLFRRATGKGLTREDLTDEEREAGISALPPHGAFKKGENGQHEKMETFDPTATEVLYIPQIAGG